MRADTKKAPCSKQGAFRNWPSKVQSRRRQRELTRLLYDAFRLPQIAAEALDALAGIFKVACLGRVGDAEGGAKAEGRTLHDGDAFGFQELGDKILVVAEYLAGRRLLADGAGAGWIDVERAFRTRTVDAAGLVQHGHHEVAALLEHLVVRRDEILRTVE